MLKILFINASPRKNGYTSKTLKEIRNYIHPQNKCEWIEVNNLNMKPCQGCLKCRPDKECILPEDDAHRIAKLIKSADALVLGSPTYFGNITGPLRTLIDRSLTAIESIAPNGLEMPIPIHKGKVAAIVTSCNMPDPGSKQPNQGAGALFAMETTINAGGYDLAGSIIVDGAASRTELSEEIKAKAEEIAIKLQKMS